MWNAEMQMEYAPLMGGWLAPNAHNQFIQTLGETGVVGLGVLLIVYYVFGKASWRLYSLTGGVSFFLFIYLVLRSLTEVSIVLAATQSNFIIFWTFYAILISSWKFKTLNNLLTSKVTCQNGT
jgi:O-antigen ligase